MATLNLGRIKPVFRGAYSGSTAYVVDDIVTSGGSSYICIQAHGAGTQAVTQTAYWTLLAQGGDVASTLTAQGDVLYRDGSGLAKLAAGTSGQFLKTLGSGQNPAWADAGGGFQSIQTFSSNGTYTKPAGIKKIKVYTTGGGAGGAGAASNSDFGGGGGAGGTAIEVLDATSINTVTVTVGAGGAAVTGDHHGNAGATSSFGSYHSASGGGVGRHGNAGNVFGGAGGTASGGDINITGGSGNFGDDSDNNHMAGGSGGSSFWGGAGRGCTGSGSYSGTDGVFGSGGGGGANNHASRAGGTGFVLVEEYK